MKIFLNLCMALVFVITTTLPLASHAAMPQNTAKAAQERMAEHSGCHKQATAQPAQAPKHEQHSPNGKCCEKGLCQCTGSTCHTVLKIFGNNTSASFAVAPRAAPTVVRTTPMVHAALLNRLTRPPRA